MSGFYVAADELPQLAAQLGRLGDYAEQARSYVHKNTQLGGGEGWLNRLSGAHGSVVNQTLSWLASIGDPLADQSASAVDRTVTTYRAIDYDASSAFDATLPANGSLLDLNDHEENVFSPYARSGRFEDVFDPGGSLRPPPDYHHDERYTFQPQWYDLASFAGLTRQAVWHATGLLASFGWLDRAYDPYEIVLKPVVGDWAGFRACVDVFHNLAAALGTMASNLRRTQYTLPAVWRGHAADSCSVHLGRIHRVLLDAEEPLHAIAGSYERASLGQADFRTVVAVLLDDLIDAAIILVIAIKAGAATAKTVVGPLIGGAVAVSAARRIVRIIGDILDMWARIDGVIAAEEGLMNAFGQLDASTYHLPRLPEVTGGHSTLDHLPSEWEKES
jgi:hypothetical protein